MKMGAASGAVARQDFSQDGMSRPPLQPENVLSNTARLSHFFTLLAVIHD